MLHNEARKLLAQAYEQTRDAQTAAKSLRMSTGTVHRSSGQMKKPARREPAPDRGRFAGHPIIVRPDITIGGITEKQRGSVSNEAVRNAAIAPGCVYKKKSFYPAERERVRCCGSGRMTRGKFPDCLKNTLIPTLREGDPVVMDNMHTHHVKEVRTLLQRGPA